VEKSFRGGDLLKVSLSIEAEKFADWMGLLRRVNDIITPLGIDQEKIYTTIIDSDHISMLRFIAEKNAFKKFNVVGSWELGIDTEEIQKMLTEKFQIKNIVGTLDIDFNDPELELTLKLPKQKTKRHFYFTDLSTIHDPEYYIIPDLLFTAKVILEASVFKSIVQDCYKVSDNFSLWIGKNIQKLCVTAHYEKSLSYLAEIQDIIEIESEGEAKGNYNLSFIVDILPYLHNQITIHLGVDICMRIDFTLWGAQCSYIIAPRVMRDQKNEIAREVIV